MFLVVGELAIAIIFIAFVYTQIFLPLKSGLPTLPFFRKEKVLRNDLANVNQDLVEKQISDAINKVREELEKKNSDQEKPQTTKDEEKKDA